MRYSETLSPLRWAFFCKKVSQTFFHVKFILYIGSITNRDMENIEYFQYWQVRNTANGACTTGLTKEQADNIVANNASCFKIGPFTGQRQIC